MTEVLLFGGTAEGRALYEYLNEKRTPALVCVATEYGGAILPPSDSVLLRSGRLDAAAMQRLIAHEKPRLVIDATHPYAQNARANIGAACARTAARLVRLSRECSDSADCPQMATVDKLVAWINERDGILFSALGAKEAAALTAVRDFQERVWLRILPDARGLQACIKLGFSPKRIICMQGPFSRQLNAAMFRACAARLLVTKNAGAAGGFTAKLEAARDCGMQTAVLARPAAEGGLGFAEVVRLLEEGRP